MATSLPLRCSTADGTSHPRRAAEARPTRRQADGAEVHAPRPTPERYRPSQSWSTFIRNHAADTWACDFIQTFDLWFRPIFAFVMINVGTREVVHVNATYHPTEQWTTQQLREALGRSPKRTHFCSPEVIQVEIAIA